jgi:hypothetical protein
LFVYVFFNPKILFHFSPGIGFQLEVNDINCIVNYLQRLEELNLCVGDPERIHGNPQLPKRQLKTLRTTRDLLIKSQNNPPFFWCFGLHEWAMLYPTIHDKGNQKTTTDSRFQNLPLRVQDDEIRKIFSSLKLRCSHFDAFRFFPPEMQRANIMTPEPSRQHTLSIEQPGCIHTNMDLFK